MFRQSEDDSKRFMLPGWSVCKKTLVYLTDLTQQLYFAEDHVDWTFRIRRKYFFSIINI